MTGLLNFLLSLDALKTRRTDDGFTADYRAKLRAVVGGLVLMVAALVLGFAAAKSLEIMQDNSILAAAAEAVREPAGYAFLIGVALAGLFTFLAWLDLVLFVRKHGAH